METEAFCLKCKCRRALVNVRLTRASRSGGRLNLKGECSVCGKVANKLVSGKTAKEMATVQPRVEPKVEVSAELEVVAEAPLESQYKAYCRVCREDQLVIGGQMMRHFSQGMVVAGGKCTSCGSVGTFVKAQEIEEVQEAECEF